ncbi:MAG TPA: YbgC/FadM family acyl-CoA thioesterase [Steroidobacteraceae bacterium]|nr:YbgC/FadM family acyl-CoA thioesterase [Steroidobacteraceae bacterium]
MSLYCLPVRIYWEDTDGGGVVFYANYLKYLERARTEWLRHRGYDQSALARRSGVVFAVRSARIEYKLPARLDDILLVTCEPRRAGAASLAFQQRIFRHDAEARAGAPAAGELSASELERHELITTAEVSIACIDARTFRPQRMPEFLVGALQA